MELCTVRLISNILPFHSNAHAPRFFPSTISTSSPLLNHPRFTSGLTYCVNSPLGSTTSTENSTATTPSFFGDDKKEESSTATTPSFFGDDKKEESSTPSFFGDDKKEESSTPSFFGDDKKEDSSTPSFFADEKKEDSTPSFFGDEKREDSAVTVENTSLDVKKEDSVTQIKEAPQEESLSDLDLSKFFEDLGIKIDFEENKNSIIAIGAGGLIALWLASAVVGAIDSIPLLPKVLELVGLGYTIWFTIRYLIFEESRGALVAKVEKIKQDIFG